MAISRTICALAVLAVVLVAAGSAEARHHHGGHGGGGDYPRARGYLVQGNSVYEENRPKDPTPLAPTSAGPYAIAHRGSSGACPAASMDCAASTTHAV